MQRDWNRDRVRSTEQTQQVLTDSKHQQLQTSETDSEFFLFSFLMEILTGNRLEPQAQQCLWRMHVLYDVGALSLHNC